MPGNPLDGTKEGTMARKIKARAVSLLALLVMLLGGAVAVAASPAAAAPVAPAAPAPVIPPTGGIQLDTAHPTRAVKAPKGNPDAISAKAFVSCGAYPASCYSYAGKSQNYSATPSEGGVINLPITKPTLLPTDYHSLTEFTVGTADGQQLVEIGTTVDLLVCGSAANTPCLFTFTWRNGVPNPAGYNGATPLVGCAPYCMGSPVSALVGTTKSFVIQHLTTPIPGWYLAFDGAWRAVWEDTNWTGATPPATFVTSEQSIAFGEIAAGNTPTQTDIASGVLPVSSTTGSLISGYQLIIGGVATAGSWTTNKLTLPDRWNVVDVSATQFRYGGPGGNENLPTVSPTCSGVGITPTWGGFGSMCPYGNTSAGVPISPVNVLDVDASVARNVCHPNFGTADGITTSPIRVWENSSYVKFAWFRDANCAGAHIDIDYDKTVLPVGWGGGPTPLIHASYMRWSTPNSH
jgi:hypothetical protein